MIVRNTGAWLAIAGCVALAAGCGGGGDRSQRTASTQQESAAPAPPAGKAQHVTVTYYYLPG